MFRFTLFDAGEKKIARYQQFFCVKKILERIRQRDEEGERTGGVVWHTQGSGKSLTMVMLAKAIALERGLDDYKIVLVTDRVDLDDQIYRTFRHCGTEPDAGHGPAAHLAELLEGPRAGSSPRSSTSSRRPSTSATSATRAPTSSSSWMKATAASTARCTPRCGRPCRTPASSGSRARRSIKKEKNTIARFGGLIDTYTIRQAVEDKAVVPLLYEGRDVEQHGGSEPRSISWFDKLTSSLTIEQKADLKKKFATTDQLNKAEQKVKRDRLGHQHALPRQLAGDALQGPARHARTSQRPCSTRSISTSSAWSAPRS